MLGSLMPDQINVYAIQIELGRGGKGVVYLAIDNRFDREVVIKALPAQLAEDPDRLARFEREAKILASLNHPNIAAIYGLEKMDGNQYIVMEYVAGQSLADRLRLGPLPVDLQSFLADWTIWCWVGCGKTPSRFATRPNSGQAHVWQT